MEHTLTPPPSFRGLQVRTRTRTRTSSDENRCGCIPPSRINEGRSRKDISTSPTRGRTRSRAVRNGLTLNTNRTHQHISLALPSCCSPLPSCSEVRSPGCDEDLIFQMSPIQTQSPSFCYDSVHEVHANDNCRVQRSTMHALSALWEKHKTSLTTAASQPHALRTPNKRTRADTVTQHHRGLSDSHANALSRPERRGEHRPQQSAKTLLDFSSTLHIPSSPASPPASELFMYSFPSFESVPLVKARQARAHRQASKAAAREEYLTGGLEKVQTDSGVDGPLDVEIDPYPQRLGPIRARKLRIESGESLANDVDDTDFISRAFRSASLDPEKDFDLDADLDTPDDGYFSSQRSSSVSSSSTTDAASFSNNAFSSSLLASFPVRPTSQSRAHSSSSSRPHSRRNSPTKVSSDACANAMMTRGRTSRRASAEKQHTVSEYIGGDRRGRGRTPPVRWNGSDA